MDNDFASISSLSLHGFHSPSNIIYLEQNQTLFPLKQQSSAPFITFTKSHALYLKEVLSHRYVLIQD